MNHKSVMLSLGYYVIKVIVCLFALTCVVTIVMMTVSPKDKDFNLIDLIKIPFIAFGTATTGIVTIASIIVSGKRGREIAQSITGHFYDAIDKNKTDEIK